jgi:hypothetical protein
VNPGIAQSDTIGATLAQGSDLLDLVKMGACCHFLAQVLSKFHEHIIGDCFEEASGILADNGFSGDQRLTAQGALVIVHLRQPLPINFHIIHT